MCMLIMRLHTSLSMLIRKICKHCTAYMDNSVVIWMDGS
jgi:hypothetical protein